MKLEIEVTEDEIRDAIRRKVRVALVDHNSNWEASEYISTSLRAHWRMAVDALITEELKNVDAIRERVIKGLEKKIRSQITKAMKKTTKE